MSLARAWGSPCPPSANTQPPKACGSGSGSIKGRVEEAFAAFEQLGWSGMMVDFFDHDDQESVEFAESVLAAAARHRILIHLHGVWKPTGWERTYPHLVGRSPSPPRPQGRTAGHARRKGADWYLGGLAAHAEPNLLVPLAFLTPGRHTARIWTDAPDAESQPNHLLVETLGTSAADRLQLRLATGGGFVAVLSPE